RPVGSAADERVPEGGAGLGGELEVDRVVVDAGGAGAARALAEIDAAAERGGGLGVDHGAGGRDGAPLLEQLAALDLFAAAAESDDLGGIGAEEIERAEEPRVRIDRGGVGEREGDRLAGA